MHNLKEYEEERRVEDGGKEVKGDRIFRMREVNCA
jgi:hypothetical protein